MADLILPTLFLAYPFMPGRLVPAPAGGSSVYSCHVTAGSYSAITGYLPTTSTGSIDTEPVPGQTLSACYTSSNSYFNVFFSGNIASLLAGLHVWLDGIDYGIGDSGTRFTYSSGNTKWSITSGLPSMTVGNTYLLEIK